MRDTKKLVRGSLIGALGAFLLLPACRDDRAMGTERGKEPVGVDRPAEPAQPTRSPEAPMAGDYRRGLDNPLHDSTTGLAGAVDSIAAAQCAYAERCGEVGAGDDKDHASREACLSKLKADLRDDLDTDECKGGAVQKEVDECLAEIRDRECNNPIDAISKLAACRTSDLCKALP